MNAAPRVMSSGLAGACTSLALAVLALACGGDASQGKRGPKRALPVDGAPPAAEAEEEVDVQAEAAPDSRAPEAHVRSLGTKGAVDCPVGTEPRGAAPPVAFESYCLRRTDGDPVRHGPYRQWYPDGTVRAEGKLEDGERDGTWTEFFEDGTPKAITTFAAGVRDGKWRTFHPDGTPEGEGSYDGGKKSGLATFWWENGTKKAEGTWKDDVKVGESTNWSADGKLQSRGSYVAGNKHGEWIDVDASGTEVKSTWADGVRVGPPATAP
jgi:hypothetical protein